MGVETTKALQARRRAAAAHTDRLIAQADERNPIGSARRARIKESARLARRRVTALAAAQQAVTAIEVEIGRALLRVVDQGLSRNEAFEIAGLTRHLGRRYVELAERAQAQVPADPSTGSATERAVRPLSSDLDPTGACPVDDAPERNI